MIPIHELLNRIRWDPEFAKGDFQLGYYDRAEDRITYWYRFRNWPSPTKARRHFSSPTWKGGSIEFPFTACARFTRTLNVFGIGAGPRHIPNMAVSESYRDFVLEQLGRVMPVTGKSMFGGVGLYANGLFFALIAEDRLYFKVDDTTRPDFERLGMEPFRPFGEDSAMGYYEVPVDVVEDSVQLAPWMRKAIDVAANVKGKQKSNRVKR